MEAPITAIGFSKIEDEDKLQQIVKEILDKPTKQLASKTKDKQILGEYYKKYGENTYLMVRILVRSEEKDAKIEVEQCEPYVEASHFINVEELVVESIDDDYSYYAVCEEKETGMPFIFWVQNIIDYIEAQEENKEFNKVKVVGLATEGTIILPIERDEEEESIEREEREKFKIMVQRARTGDEEAKELLEKEEKELDEQLKERMLEEDFLSIMSGYFVPTTLEDAIYAILGEIKEIHERKNIKTKEEMYLFVLNVNDMPLEVMINKKTLVGKPSVGMRFMGTCWLQGTVDCQ